MRRLFPFTISLVALAMAGCAVSWQSLQTAVPKDLFHQDVACPTHQNVKAEDFQVLSTYKWSKGVVVLYSALCPNNRQPAALERVFGHKVMERNGKRWQVSGSDSFGEESQPSPSERLVNYDISKSSSSGDRYTILYGQILAPKVAAVEATFDNGKVVRDEGMNGVFALISPGATGVCELRVLGPDNQILHTDDFVIPPAVARTDSHQCLPVTQQL